jgi:hypothetical protein
MRATCQPYLIFLDLISRKILRDDGDY